MMCAFGFGLVRTPVTAAEAVPIPIDAMLDMRSFGDFQNPSYSPDGRYLAVTIVDNVRRASMAADAIYRTGMNWNGNGADIYVVDMSTCTMQNVTGSTGDNYHPSWAPDSKTLGFVSDRGGSGAYPSASLWTWNVTTHQLRGNPGVDAMPVLSSIAWTDADTALLTVLPAGLTRAAYSATMIPPKPAVTSGDAGVRVLDYGTDAAKTTGKGDFTNLDFSLGDLAAVDIRNGTMRRLVTGRRIEGFAVSPDRRSVAFVAPVGFDGDGSSQTLADLGVVAANGGAPRILGHGVPLGFNGASLSWSPQSTSIAFEDTGRKTSGQVRVYDAAGVKPLHQIGFPDKKNQDSEGGSPPAWDAAGRTLTFIAGDDIWTADATADVATRRMHLDGYRFELLPTESGRAMVTSGGVPLFAYHDAATKAAGFAAIDLAAGGIVKKLTLAARIGGVVESAYYNVAPDGKTLTFLSESANAPPDLWTTNAALDTPRRLTKLNPDILRYAFGESRLLSWQSQDGQTLHGALLLPPNAVAGKHYPLILKVYAGSDLSNGLNRFGGEQSGVDNLQLFTSRGYAVLLPDAPQKLGTPMVDIAKTILPGIDAAVATGFIDPQRIGVMGHSFGGYTTMSLLVQSDRFRAALVSAGEADFISAYGEMNQADGTAYQIQLMETGQGLMGGTLWEQPMRYIENSPVFHMDRVNAAVLIVHGDDDTAVAPFLTDQMFVFLRRLGKTVEYARYAGEDHWEGTWSNAHQIDYLKRVFGWFDRYLMHAPPK